MRQAVRQRRAVPAGHRAVRVPAWLGGRPVPALRGALQVSPRGAGGGDMPCGGARSAGTRGVGVDGRERLARGWLRSEGLGLGYGDERLVQG